MFWKLLLIINVVLLLICINFSRFIVGQGKIDVGKGTGGPPLAVLCTFYSQRMSIALQRVQVNTILRHAIFIGESSSSHCFSSFLSLQIILIVISRGSRTWFVPFFFCDPLWGLSFWLKLRSSLFVLSFPPLLDSLFNGVYQDSSSLSTNWMPF
jgi:hypothetical protein